MKPEKDLYDGIYTYIGTSLMFKHALLLNTEFKNVILLLQSPLLVLANFVNFFHKEKSDVTSRSWKYLESYAVLSTVMSL